MGVSPDGNEYPQAILAAHPFIGCETEADLTSTSVGPSRGSKSRLGREQPWHGPWVRSSPAPTMKVAVMEPMPGAALEEGGIGMRWARTVLISLS